jgi:acyl-coenzyme A synthetase/AMP-(fatty) acid ligase/acyl carrier protein
MLQQGVSKDDAPELTRAFIIGGEALRAESLRLWREHCPKTRLINEYGPTETVVGCCIHEVQSGDPLEGSVPIGRPIANVRLYVLDAAQRLVPSGVPGELYIGGHGLARGYMHQPGLTAERFVPDPFGGEVGGRLYRTGDRVRYLPGGILEFLGRIDGQVKLRGYRIEPAEIENCLNRHPVVGEAVVIIREDQPGDKRLVAYITGRGSDLPSPRELRTHVRRFLPEYMVPSAFVSMHQFPLTANGKVNRKALPPPDETSLATARDVHPETEVEKVLALTWQKILKVDHVGANDNFFELGGYSLLATRLISEIQNMFQVQLSLRSIFENPTLAELAKRVEAEVAAVKAESTEREEIEHPIALREVGTI